ncbi:hypothetical protein [Agitococcus lubricus]|uniref:Zinc ribbon protein n=1 Tax=Agitococcus lubricus TaxID=1077255 RepID=A0A2T5IYN0_9GAMM|nr:hypothetical protein [Agitococcus lubricus]PTQ89128.1 hypothetical protein C8N29_1087 [Agitococcus lubricus]
MTIRHILWIQHTYKACLSLSSVLAVILFGAILDLYSLPAHSGNVMTVLLAALLVSCGVLILVLRKVRCPVCRYVFVGKREPSLLTRSCRNCGRRAGDTG